MRMKHRTLAAAVVAAALLATPALAQAIPPAAISITGEATVSVPPDQALIDGGVTSEAKTAREASDANNTAMGKVLLALKGAGIDEKDYQTSRLSLQPQFAANYKPSDRAGIVSFRASNRVIVRIRDVTKVANVIDVLAGDVLHIPSWVQHKAEALEDTLDVDIFNPPRQDWLDKTDDYLRQK